MKLNRIGLNDFGVYQNEDIRGIDEGITIIAGPQRAGKTTFMKALRHLPYGITRGDDVPPASNQYDIFAEVEQEDQEFNIRLKGQAQPEASSNSAENTVSLDGITGQIDKTQYKQLFTISLNQLKKLPDGIENEKRLSEVLLGAAFGKIAEIPQIKDDFGDEAEDIGLSRGNPKATTTELNNPYKEIQNGLEKKKKALKQVDKYKQKKQQLEKIVSEIEKAEQEISRLGEDITRLGVVEDEFDEICKLQRIKDRCSDEQIENAKSFPKGDISKIETLRKNLKQLTGTTEVKQGFEKLVEDEDAVEYREKLLDKKDVIAALKQEISGWSNQLKTIEQKRDEIDSKETEIKERISGLGPSYEGRLEEVEKVETDVVTKEEVSKTVKELKDAISELKGHEKELKGIKSQLETVEDELEDFDEENIKVDKSDVLKQVSIISGVPLAVLAGLSYAGFLIPGIIASTLLLMLLVYIKSGDIITDTESEGTGELKGEKKRLKSEKQREGDQKETVEEEKKQISNEIKDLMDSLELKDVETPTAFESVYKEVVDIKKDIKQLETEKSKLQDSEKKLDNELYNAAENISYLKSMILGEDLEENLNDLESKLKELEKELEAAEKVQEEIDEKENKKKQIKEILDKTELLPNLNTADNDEEFIELAKRFIELGKELKEALKDYEEAEKIETRLKSKFNRKRNRELFEEFKEEEKTWISALKTISNQFADKEEIQNKIKKKKKEKQRLEQEKPEESERSKLKTDLDNLSSDEDIMEAQEQIEEGRKKLQRLGEEYTVNRFAEKMSDKLNQKFIEDIAGSLINEAGEIFSEVTEEYEDLEHNNKIDDLRFEALKEGSSQEVEELSRATKEQLFMSLRIARIKQLDAKLPIVIDDSMTNFDPEHTGRMLEIIQQVAAENQVFILTCHPELIDIAEEKIEVSNYYSLEEGEFKKYEESSEIRDILKA